MLLSETRERRIPLVTDAGLDRRLIALEIGAFDIGALISEPQRCLGLFVADGLVTAHIEAGRAQVAWMLGAGDLIHPWEMAGVSLTTDARWRALTNATVVRIDRVADSQAQPDPAVIEKLLRRAGRTNQWLLASSLILSSPSIMERLLLLFEHYGERWGKVTPAGVRIELPLTHELLGQLCGARRSTVTLAITSLANDGFISRVSRDVWLLHRRPELNAGHPCWTHYAATLGFNHGARIASRVAEPV